MSNPVSPVADQRYLAVDVLRGATVALMITVNMAISPEASFGVLLHSVWHGFTLADAVFPTFLFVVGNAMALAFDRPADRRPGWGKIVRRSLLLIAVGWFVSNFPFGRFNDADAWAWTQLANIRIPGVLQRIGLAYLLSAVVIRLAGARGAWTFAVLAVPLNWWLMQHFGDLTLEGSAALKLDLAVFGPTHLYQGEGQPYDPEGLLGTIPATVNMLAGYLAMRAIRAAPEPAAAVGKLALAGVLLLAAGLAWHQGLPLNKKLWTSSFVLFTVGLDLAVLALCVWLLDVRRLTFGSGFFGTFGRNPLALYVISEVLMSLAWTFGNGEQSLFMAIYNTVFLGQITGKVGSLAYGFALVLLVWAIGRWMDRRSIYVRL